MNGLKLTID